VTWFLDTATEIDMDKAGQDVLRQIERALQPR
jgi:hypothetical protein